VCSLRCTALGVAAGCGTASCVLQVGCLGVAFNRAPSHRCLAVSIVGSMALAAVSQSVGCARVLYFILGLEASVLTPFFSLFMAQCHLNGSHVGAVLGCRFFVSLLVAPLWGSALDASRHWSSRRLFVGVLLMLRVVPTFSMLVVFVVCQTSTSPSHHSTTPHLGAAAAAAAAAAGWQTQVVDAMGGVFPSLLVAVAVYAFLYTPVQTFVDATTLAVLHKDRTQYGRVRALLSVGMGLGALAAGMVVDRFGAAAAWIATMVLMALDSFVGVLLTHVSHPITYVAPPPAVAGAAPAPQSQSQSQALSQCHGKPRPAAPVLLHAASGHATHGRQGVVAGVRRIRQALSNWHMVLFLVVASVLGVGSATYDVYIVLFMHQLHAPGWLVGASVGAGCASNVVFFFLAPWLIRKAGCRAMLVASMVAFCIRVYLYSLCRRPWQILPVQLLHGINFSVMWSAGVEFCQQQVDTSSVATAQALFQGSFSGVGSLVGLFLGGWLFDHFGARDMFLIKGAATFAAMLVFVAVELLPYHWRERAHRRRTQAVGTVEGEAPARFAPDDAAVVSQPLLHAVGCTSPASSVDASVDATQRKQPDLGRRVATNCQADSVGVGYGTGSGSR